MPGWWRPATASRASAKAATSSTARTGRGRDSSEAPAFGGAFRPRPTAPAIEHLLRDNYETPLYAPTLAGQPDRTASDGGSAEALGRRFRGARAQSGQPRRTLRLHREAADAAALRPACSGSRCTISISRTPAHFRSTRRHPALRPAVRGALAAPSRSDPEYASKTTMFILPDFGRDSDIDSGGNGFQHHRTGDALSRTTWMMVLGPGVRQNVVVDRPHRIDRSGAYARRLLRLRRPLRRQGKPIAEVA